jgi:hypothetical protein
MYIYMFILEAECMLSSESVSATRIKIVQFDFRDEYLHFVISNRREV